MKFVESNTVLSLKRKLPIFVRPEQTRKLGIALFLVAITVGLFWQVHDFPFIPYDDDQYVSENSTVHAGLTRAGIRWAFTTFHASNWHPVTWLSHMMDVEIFGLEPGMHHASSVLLHVANTLLLFVVLCRMTGLPARSGFVAALFAVHPLHVESVAWVAERKDVLSAFFWMLTIWGYLRYVERPTLPRYSLVAFTFGLGLLSKPMVVTLPFVLVLIDYWPLRRFSLDHEVLIPFLRERVKGRIAVVLLEKMPLFLMSAGSCIVTLTAQETTNAVTSTKYLPIASRFSNAIVAYFSYMAKTVFPSGLAVFYPHPEGFLPAWKVLGAGAILLCVTILALRERERRPYLLIGWFWFLGTLVPVIGVVQVGLQGMADRYTYLPLIGVFIMLAWIVPDLLGGWRWKVHVLSASAVTVVFSLFCVAWFQVGLWSSGAKLFSHALQVTRDNWVAANSLGLTLFNEGNIDESVWYFRKSLTMKPSNAEASSNLGMALFRQGRTAEALAVYDETLRANPRDAVLHNNLGDALFKQGRLDEAAEHLRSAVSLRPDFAKAHNNLGAVIGTQGNTSVAIHHFTEALRLDPDYVQARFNLGYALAQEGRTAEAIVAFRETLRLDPRHEAAQVQLEMLSR